MRLLILLLLFPALAWAQPYLFRPDGSGKYILIGKLQATQWLELAKTR